MGAATLGAGILACRSNPDPVICIHRYSALTKLLPAAGDIALAPCTNTSEYLGMDGSLVAQIEL